MIILRIEHKVTNYDGWKRTFDSDPINRKKSGVRRYSIATAIDDSNFIFIDLEFDTVENAEAALTALRNLWGPIEGKVILKPQARILHITEEKEL